MGAEDRGIFKGSDEMIKRLMKPVSLEDEIIAGVFFNRSENGGKTLSAADRKMVTHRRTSIQDEVIGAIVDEMTLPTSATGSDSYSRLCNVEDGITDQSRKFQRGIADDLRGGQF